MKLIEINEKHLVNNKDHQVGPFQKIMILGFEDLEGKNLSMVMLGQSVDLLYVPRKLTEQEFDKKLKSIQLDPMRETADIDLTNNFWGEIVAPTTKFEVFKQKNSAAVRGAAQGKINPMQAGKKN